MLIHLQLLLICRKFFLNLLTVYLLYYFYLQDSSGEPKVIVYVSLLLKLFTICQLEDCGASIDPSNIETYRRGACLTVSRTCNNNHGFEVNMFVEELKLNKKELNNVKEEFKNVNDKIKYPKEKKLLKI